MFSNLGQIFGIKPRHAENTDTRLGIRRHDPDQQQRRQNKSENEEASLFDVDDSATVSVLALSMFLDNFLKASSSNKEISISAAPSHTNRSENESALNQPPQTPSPASRAAQAYQSTAKASPTSMMPNETSQETQSYDLEAEDVRTIHRLLEDLKILNQQAIEFVRIERGESFLQSLVDAVAKAKSA